jgi:hypothetical protein
MILLWISLNNNSSIPAFQLRIYSKKLRVLISKTIITRILTRFLRKTEILLSRKRIIEVPKQMKQIAVLAFIEINSGLRLFRTGKLNIQPISTIIPIIADMIPDAKTIVLRYFEILYLILKKFRVT